MEESKEADRPEQEKKKRKVFHQNSTRELDATKVKQQLWLVKVPPWVASSWAQAKHNDELGQMMVGVKPGEGTKQMIIKLNDQSVPTQFTLDEMKTSSLADGNTMLAFDFNEEKKQFTIEGSVTKSLLLKPARTTAYQNFIRERSMAANANRRELTIADPQDLERASKQSYTIEFMSNVKAELKKKGAAKGPGEMDIKALKSKMFEAFEAGERLPFDSLLTASSQVAGFSREQDLRAVLDKYAFYHHKGPHRGLWELKSQFKTNIPTAESSSSTS